MSTLVAQTISNGTVSTSSANVIQGSAKAWINYNGSTQTIASSFNVSSVTYIEAGNYLINFTTAMPNTNYVTLANGTIDFASASNQYFAGMASGNGTPLAKTTSAVRVASMMYNGSIVNTQQMSVAIFSL